MTNQIITRPSHKVGIVHLEGRPGITTPEYQVFFDDLVLKLNATLLGAAVQVVVYTVATLPSVAPTGGLIFVTDEAGGAIPAFSDGVNWRRVTDREVVA